MKKIKIIRSRPLKEEEEVIDQLPQDTAPETPEITFESNPLEFILQKYPSLTETLTDLLTEDFRDYIVGVYIMAPKPTTFKIVLHNNRYFYLAYLGRTYQAKVSGKKYYLARLSELEMATIAIADLLIMGAPPQTQGPEEELTSTPEEPAAEEEGGGETITPDEGGGEEELTEGKKRFKIIESLLEAAKLDYDVLTPDAKKIAQDLIKKLGITQDQIQPKSSTGIVVYTDENRKDLVKKVEDLKIYGSKDPKEPNAGNFKIGKISINFKPHKTSGEFYELKPQNLGITLDKYISPNQLKKELINGIKNHKSLSDVQKKFILGLIAEKNTLSSDEKAEILNDKYLIAEVLKNLGEPLGALLFAKENDGTGIFIPGKGNYPLVDYFVKTSDGDIIEISAKSSKGKGNIIKIPDINNKVKQANGRLNSNIQKIFDIISSNGGKDGSLKLIPEFAPELNARYKKFLKNNPNFPKAYDSAERIQLEKGVIKAINDKYNFNDIFKKYVNIQYVKYGFDNDLKPNINVIKGEAFNVYLDTKNSTYHDGERIGFQLANKKK